MAELKRKMDEGAPRDAGFLHQRLQRKGLTAAQQKAMREILQSLLPSSGPVDESDLSWPNCALSMHHRLSKTTWVTRPIWCVSRCWIWLRACWAKLGPGGVQGHRFAGRVDGSADSASAYLSGGGGDARQAARRSRRPPSARQLKAQEQAQDAKAALRSIYRQLASALHPDREPDPVERERKSALMSQANAAYERGDLTALLQLQLQAEQVDEAHIAQMADDKLAACRCYSRIRLKRWKANWETQRCA